MAEKTLSIYITDIKAFCEPCPEVRCPLNALYPFLKDLNQQSPQPTFDEVKRTVKKAGLNIRNEQPEPKGLRAICDFRGGTSECASVAVVQVSLPNRDFTR